uniref:CEP44 domain-containing protein n=1 Tax=Macrostomum lignano TaxID=282301 RepID=A0A1I8GWP2_9PLAT
FEHLKTFKVVPDDYDTRATIKFLRDARLCKKKRIPTFLRMVDRVLGGMKRQPFPRMDLLSTSESDAEPPQSRSLHQRPHSGIDSDSAEGVESDLQLLPPPQQKVLPTATSGAMSRATGMDGASLLDMDHNRVHTADAAST